MVGNHAEDEKYFLMDQMAVGLFKVKCQQGPKNVTKLDGIWEESDAKNCMLISSSAKSYQSPKPYRRIWAIAEGKY